MQALPGSADITNEEKNLVRELHDGDEVAMRHIYKTYANALFWFSYNITRNSQDAQDLVSDTFLTYWENRSTLHSVDHIRNFLYNHIRRRSFNQLKTGNRQEEIRQDLSQDDLVEYPDTLNKMIHAELLGAIMALIQELPEKQRIIVEQLIMNEKSAKEVAEYLNISISDVYTTKHRALLYLRAYAIHHKWQLSWLLLAYALFRGT